MNDVFSYAQQYLNHLLQRETSTCTMSSGILMYIGITFDDEERGHL